MSETNHHDHDHDHDDTEMDPHAAESEFSLADLKPDQRVERYVRLGGQERRLVVDEAADADAPDLQNARQTEAELYRTLAEFFRDHIHEPAAFATISADDLREMRMGTAEKLLSVIVPEREGNRQL